MLLRIKIRTNLAKIRPEALELDGKVFNFREGWNITELDSSIYVGEIAMIPTEPNYFFAYPNAPAWIASGDLEGISSQS